MQEQAKRAPSDRIPVRTSVIKPLQGTELRCRCVNGSFLL